MIIPESVSFKSMPDKFEVWINKNNLRAPLKIKSKGLIDYSILMKKYSSYNN